MVSNELARRSLPASFYLQPTLEVAQQLIGKELVHFADGTLLSGLIVETEAYLVDDPANHAWRGLTARNRAMFGPPGRAYVYKVHMQYCLNAVTQPEGVAEAVLIRALMPLGELDLMRLRRGVEGVRALCSGPGKLTQALGIGLQLNGCDLARGPLFIIEPTPSVGKLELIQTTRVGIRVAEGKPWRFYSRSHEMWVSKRATRP